MSYLSSHTGSEIDNGVDAAMRMIQDWDLLASEHSTIKQTVEKLEAFMKEPWLYVPGMAMPLSSLMREHMYSVDEVAGTVGQPMPLDAYDEFLGMNEEVFFTTDLPEEVIQNVPMFWLTYSEGPDAVKGKRRMQLHYIGSSFENYQGEHYCYRYYATPTMVDFRGDPTTVYLSLWMDTKHPGRYRLASRTVNDTPDDLAEFRALLTAQAAQGYMPF